jgi:hypothetical protein
MTEEKIICEGHYRTGMCIGINPKTRRKIFSKPDWVKIKNCDWCKNG